MFESSIKILEGLLYTVPNLLSVYKLIDLPSISSVKHPEYNNIYNHFENPTIIISIGLTTVCFVIQREKKQTFHVIEIGSEVIYYKTTSGKLNKEIINILKQKDYMPQPLTKKLVLVDEYSNSKIAGRIYRELLPNKYINENATEESYKPSELIKDTLNKMVLI